MAPEHPSHRDRRIGSATELARAAADLEAVTRKYDECVRALEDVEATADALLDDQQVRVLVLDGTCRVVALSRGIVTAIGPARPALGRPASELLPDGWPEVEPVTKHLSAGDGWLELPIADGSGQLCLRRVTEDDRDALYVLRFEPAPPRGGDDATASGNAGALRTGG